jgi:adenylosuccinate synthase
MPVTVIVGGQFGSEGKGKVAHYIAREHRATVAIRVGGSNSGHTAIDRHGIPRVFRVLPTPALLDDVMCVLGAGSYIDVEILFSEMRVAQLSAERLVIDPNAYIITEEHKRAERQSGLRERIGSTQSGTGAAVGHRIARHSSAHLARHDPRLQKFLRPARSFLRSALNRNEHVIIEGTQGFGLSLLHSRYYPKATSRDTTAATFVAEAGLSPLDVRDIVLVLRAFPIRVPGDSGDLPRQIDWETVAREGSWETNLVERTSVTDQIRRVGRFDPQIPNEAIEVHRPTKIVLNHLDYFDFTSHRSRTATNKVIEALRGIETDLNQSVDFLGLGQDILIPREKLPHDLTP